MGHLNHRGVFAAGFALGILCFPPISSVAQSLRQADLPSAVIVIRHADKASEPVNDPGLTEAGSRRAQDLVTALGDAGITGIVTTQMRRTRDTAQPLATKLGVAPEVGAYMTVPTRALIE